MPSRWCISRLVQNRISWSNGSTAPANLLAHISAPMTKAIMVSCRTTTIWDNSYRCSLSYLSSADFILHLSPKNTSTVYKNQLGRPIRMPYLEQHLDPYALRIVKFVYTVPNLLWVHTVQRTHSKNRHADMAMQWLPFWDNARQTRRTHIQHNNNEKVCVYYGIMNTQPRRTIYTRQLGKPVLLPYLHNESRPYDVLTFAALRIYVAQKVHTPSCANKHAVHLSKGTNFCIPDIPCSVRHTVHLTTDTLVWKHAYKN